MLCLFFRYNCILTRSGLESWYCCYDLALFTNFDSHCDSTCSNVLGTKKKKNFSTHSTPSAKYFDLNFFVSPFSLLCLFCVFHEHSDITKTYRLIFKNHFEAIVYVSKYVHVHPSLCLFVYLLSMQ